MAVITIRWRASLLFLISLICMCIFLVYLFKKHQPKTDLKLSPLPGEQVELPINFQNTSNSSSPDNNNPHDHDNDHQQVKGGMSLIELLKPNHFLHERKTKADFYAMKAELAKLLTLLSKVNDEDGTQEENQLEEILNPQPTKKPLNSYVIATTICEKLNETDNQLIKSLVMIKSVLISQLLYATDMDRVDIHFIIKWHTDKMFIHDKLEKFGVGTKLNGTTLGIYFHNVTDIKRTDYYKQLSLSQKISQEENECNFLHLLLPNILEPADSTLYVSTDTIITGSIAEIWKEFHKMDGNQILGIARQSTKVPEATEASVSNGVILMNLTRMRNLNWIEKLFESQEDHSSTFLQLFSSFLFSSKNIWYPLPCQFNFRFDPIHCTPKTSSDLCQICDCTVDQLGIQTIQHIRPEHGTTFSAVFEAYQKVNMSDPNLRLIAPVKNVYATLIDKKNNHTNCFETLNKFLFRNFFP